MDLRFAPHRLRHVSRGRDELDIDKMLLSPQFQDSQVGYYCKDINVAVPAKYGRKKNSKLIKTKAHNIPRSKSGHPQPEATITCCYQRPTHLKSDRIQNSISCRVQVVVAAVAAAAAAAGRSCCCCCCCSSS